MYSQVKSGYLYGLASDIVAVETDLSPGLPALTVVGLPDISVKESRERIRTAMINSGLKFPSKRITINLSPAGKRKEGTHFDLPIAVGIMASLGYINEEKIKDYAFIGELSLDGRINGITGALPLIIGLRNHGISRIILPAANAEEASIIHDVLLYPVSHLKEIVENFENGFGMKRYRPKESIHLVRQDIEDFSDVSGQETVKRALQIAAAASHNVLMIGPPGAGKTMMARRLPSILPEMTYEEKLEVTKIYSIAGELSESKPVINERPFRSPHHTISATALVGGGINPKPGEISLAHYGVLFLDELPEFSRNVLEMLRQPIEDEKVTISRIRGTINYPSKMLLLASMNPCPCGYFGDPSHQCTCRQSQIDQYFSRLSGPLLDRIDLHIEIMPVKYQELIDEEAENSVSELTGNGKKTCWNSCFMREQVEVARQTQLERYKEESISYNSQLTPKLIKKYCVLDKGTKGLLEEAYVRLSLSARAHHKIIKLGRTIADMEGSERVQMNHIAEAIRYRSLDKMYRGN